MNKVYGYIRVSSVDQNEARQRVDLIKWGVAEENTFIDKLSGKDFNRPQYQALRRLITKGDVLVVKSLDRLGRSYRDIQEEWRYLVKQKQADIVILDMPILDTRIHQDLVGTLISDIVLQLLSYVAQVERENIRQRQAEGIAAARKRGVHLGRRARPTPEGFFPLKKEVEARRMTRLQAAQALGVSKNQFIWLMRKHKEP